MKSIRNHLSFVAISLVASVVVGGTASAADAPAVQWKVSDGGNGHWYSVDATLRTWIQAQSGATNRGAHLASFTSLAEQTSAVQLTNFSQQESIWIGLIQAAGAQEPAGGWAWVTGEPISFSGWTFNNPNDSGGENVAEWTPSWGGGWNDMPEEGSLRPALLEYSADCNGDGVVDYGQIQSGELADTNNNGVPDVCELVITSVQPISGASTGGTAVRINGNNFPSSPIVTFGGGTATDIVRVTPSLITAVTPAGTPGMAVVTVNSASSESFYYRPSCDGDLDNNGTIDSSDLGLMLVNYGNCYESAVPEPQEQEPFILQSLETPKPGLNKK